MRQKFPIISFIGWHNSGKTTLIRAIASELKSRGLKVGVLKSSHHTGLISHKPGSDTDLYSKDGIPHIGLVTPEGYMLYIAEHVKEPLWLAFNFFPDVDIIICEGFKNSIYIPKIEIVLPDKELLIDKVSNVVALIGEVKENRGVPVFDKKDIIGITDFIVSYLFPHKDKETLYLFVNGKFIPLKKYVRESFKGVIEGFINALKGTKGAKVIDIKIKK